MTAAERLAEYYRSPGVAARIAEYCGGVPESPESFSSWSIAAFGGRQAWHESDGAPVVLPNRELAAVLAEGADVCRALADRDGAVLQLDVDYTNPRDGAEAYRDPAACYARLEPVYEAVAAVFAGYGIEPRAVMTGRGYHFTLRAPRDSPFHSDLLAIGAPPVSMRLRYDGLGFGDAPAMGKAHDGAGRLLEHLAHDVMRRLDGKGAMAVSLADLPPPQGGPFVCLDLTAYADPLFERSIRCAFSGNQKASVGGVAPDRPFVIHLPRAREGRMADLLRAREDPEAAAASAPRTTAAIPDVREAPAWVESYRRSRLARFHAEFDAGPTVPRDEWPYTYDRLDLLTLPACVRPALTTPNPVLLVPEHLRSVALGLWAAGWHPRSIAGLIRSRYERDFRWGDLWRRYDPAARAEFYVRVLCGAVVDGLEDRSAWTCESQARRGVCPATACGWDLGRSLDDVMMVRAAIREEA